jgi:hypothetical protein
MNQQYIENQRTHHTTQPRMSPQLHNYLEALNTVATEAGLCAVSCIGTGMKELTRIAQLALDAQDVAHLALTTVSRCSPVNDVFAATAAKVFEATALEADRWKDHHEPCRNLAHVARHASNECRKMASA